MRHEGGVTDAGGKPQKQKTRQETAGSCQDRVKFGPHSANADGGLWNHIGLKTGEFFLIGVVDAIA